MRQCTQHGAWHLVNVQYPVITLSLNPCPAFLLQLHPATPLDQHKSNPLARVGPYSQNSCPLAPSKPGCFSSADWGKCHFYTVPAPDPSALRPSPTVTDHIVVTAMSRCPCAPLDCMLQAGRHNSFCPYCTSNAYAAIVVLTPAAMNIQLFVGLTVG